MNADMSDFKVIAVVKFNDGEALVLNRPIRFMYEEVGSDFLGSDGPFRDFLGYGGGGNAFGGRELSPPMIDGSVKNIKDHRWATWKQGYNSIVVGDTEALKKCYVYYSAHVTPDDYASLRGAYTGTVFEYWDYEKILKHEYWVNLYIKESEKVHDLKDKERKRVKRGDLIADLLIGRSMLLRAADHAKDYWHFKDLHCTLEDEEGYLTNDIDHIGKYKAAGKEYGWVSLDEEMFEMDECPLCSARWASYKARRIMKAKAGLISGILTRMGNNLREKE
jgi:hypothetical protein